MKNVSFKETYHADINRYGGVIDPYTRRYLFLFRKSQFARNRISGFIYHFLLKRHRLKRGIEIDTPVRIGAGFYIGHAFNITVNDAVIIGKNCNIHRGVLIGQENRGIRKGTPVIGDNVWIGINACIVGKVTIGDDVLIAPNTFVNFDVPAHSIVVGNPGRVFHRDNAVENYINCVENTK